MSSLLRIIIAAIRLVFQYRVTYVWLCMVMYGYQWLRMVMYGYQWLRMVIYGYVWLYMVMYSYVGYVWL